MERTILQWSYWLGILTLIVSFLWKALATLGAILPTYTMHDQGISYVTFYKASFLFFVAAIGSMSYETLKSRP